VLASPSGGRCVITIGTGFASIASFVRTGVPWSRIPYLLEKRIDLPNEIAGPKFVTREMRAQTKVTYCPRACVPGMGLLDVADILTQQGGVAVYPVPKVVQVLVHQRLNTATALFDRYDHQVAGCHAPLPPPLFLSFS
jgi:hypothetical protein